jgi:hypothetical protein
MTMLSRGKVLAALAVLTILILPPGLLGATSAPAHAAAAGTLCRHTFIPSPNVGTGDNGLDGVVTISNSDAWAVGEFSNGVAGQTLVEHWDGTSWSVVASPNVGAGSNFLDAVSADAPTDVWAVGAFGSGPGASQTLIEHWDGTSWSVVPSFSPGTGFNFLYGVTVVASNDVWAVGDAQNTGAASQTLVEHWDGTSWSVVSSPSPGSNANELRGVSADAANDVWAVGITSNTGSSLTLVEHWDGANWSVIPAVNFGSALTEFFGVTSIAPDDVWAVGDFQNTGPNQPDLPLTEHWNGTSWSALPAPISAGLSGNLHGVAAANSLKVWAVGEQFNNSTIDQTLTERWTPFGWQVLNNPPIGTNLSALRAISAPRSQTPQGFAWAVGGFFNTGASSQTLTELIVCVGVR